MFANEKLESWSEPYWEHIIRNIEVDSTGLIGGAILTLARHVEAKNKLSIAIYRTKISELLRTLTVNTPSIA